MNARRWTLISAGLLAALTLILRATPAQEAPKPRPRPADSKALRDRVIRLRAEVDLLQVEHDAVRDALRKALTEWGEVGRADKAEGEVRSALLQVQEAFRQHSEFLPNAGADLDKFLKETPPDPKISVKDLEDLKVAVKGGRGSEEAVGRLVRAGVKEIEDKQLAALDRKRKEFIERARALNEKKLDLGEAEKQYNEAR